MKSERIGTQLDRVREQIAILQARERSLAEQKQMAEDAETMKMIKKYKISSERLQVLNRLSEDEIKGILAKREEEDKEAAKDENRENTQDNTAAVNVGGIGMSAGHFYGYNR